jgi:phosphopantothenoylcysteine decarboxylase
MAGGLCDNLLTCIVRAWDFSAAPMLVRVIGTNKENVIFDYLPILKVAPAMNTLMWNSPFTLQHLNILQALGIIAVDPVSKKLACGDVGVGAMASPSDIARAVEVALTRRDYSESASLINNSNNSK